MEEVGAAPALSWTVINAARPKYFIIYKRYFYLYFSEKTVTSPYSD
jgi:hypothetical protein